MNMCLGIKQYTGQYSQSITLTRAKSETRKKNRKEMCPKGFCADGLEKYFEKVYLKKEYPSGIPTEAQEAITMAQDMTCDEFPFAISVEGGKPETGVGTGTSICIASAENSWQGGVMSNHFRGEKIKVNQKFTVKIVGFNCETLEPDGSIVRRDANATSVEAGMLTSDPAELSNSCDIDTHAESLWTAYDSEDTSKNLITLPLGDLDAGDYHASLNITAGELSLSDFTVLTYDGQEIQSEASGDGAISFTLNEAEDAVSIVSITSSVTGFDISYDSQKVMRSTDESAALGRATGSFLLLIVLCFHLLDSII